MIIEDVQHCFICGADTGTCGHLEEELTPPSLRRQIKRPSWTKRQRVVMSPRTDKDPARLERGRMAWPENRVTPEVALAQKR